MLSNYLKIAFRNLVRSKGYSLINIGGLAVGMSVAMLIGLWIWDEVSFDKYHKNYDRIAVLWQFVSFEKEKVAYNVMPIPLADELRTKYPEFESVSLSKSQSFVLANGEKEIAKTGNSVEPEFTEMMSLRMVAGTRNGLQDINSILLSQSLAKALFGSENPLNKLIKIDDTQTVKVTGVYEDFPDNSSFKEVFFLTPWDFAVAKDEWMKKSLTAWDENSFQIYAQLREGADFGQVTAKIKDIRMRREDPPGYKPEFYLHPMSRWHLYSAFENGVNTGGLIQFVWLFSIIGIFVLLLACINFMNLSTARSEKRAKEIGIRKAIGSLRGHLIVQFFLESLLVVFFAFIAAVCLSALLMPFFNEISEKNMAILWSNPWFWLMGLVFSLLTGLIAGSYPALYLSSFQPLKVLKGTFSAGRFAAVPRKVLVIMQFTVSIALIIGTIIVFRQIQYAKNRPIGYDRSGLIEIRMNTPELYGHFEPFRNDLIGTKAVEEVAEASGAITTQDGGTTNVSWQGKNPETHPLLKTNHVTHEYGKTIGWELTQGRDFSREFSTDSASIILNESAAALMGFKKPLESMVRWDGHDYRVIGIVKNMIKENPFSPVSPTFFVLSYGNVSFVTIKLSSQFGLSETLSKVESVFQKYAPASPFEYKFVDQEYAKKFSDEERIGKLSGFFTLLAIFISCLGLFGLASFIAEQRTKEIGIRKVLGASVANVWQMLSKEFVVLVLISSLLAAPIAWYFMDGWLEQYTYHTNLAWWVFAVTTAGALVITLLTVSFQAIKAALMNPVKSLRSE